MELDEEDLDVIKENTGLDLGKRHKRLKRKGDEEKKRDEVKPLEAMFDDPEPSSEKKKKKKEMYTRDERKELSRSIDLGDMDSEEEEEIDDGGDMGDFVVDDENPKSKYSQNKRAEWDKELEGGDEEEAQIEALSQMKDWGEIFSQDLNGLFSEESTGVYKKEQTVCANYHTPLPLPPPPVL